MFVHRVSSETGLFAKLVSNARKDDRAEIGCSLVHSLDERIGSFILSYLHRINIGHNSNLVKTTLFRRVIGFLKNPKIDLIRNIYYTLDDNHYRTYCFPM